MVTEDIIQRIQSLYSKGVDSQSSRLRKRQIYSKLVSASAFVLRRELLRKRHDLTEWYFVPIPCAEMIKASVHECPCIPANGCYIWRTKHKVPRPLEINGMVYIRSVSTLDGNEQITRTQFGRVKYIQSNSVLKNSLHWYMHNGYIYVSAGQLPKVLTWEMIPEDPVDAFTFPSFCDNGKKKTLSECDDPLKMEFPIAASFIEEVIELAVQELIQLFVQQTEDKLPNQSDKP